VRTATFGQPSLAWRGYSEDEVRAFLNRVADRMAAAEQERAGLQSRIDQLRTLYRDHGHGMDPASSATAHRQRDAAGDVGLLRRLHNYADVQVGRAKEYAAHTDRGSAEQADAAFHNMFVQAERVVEDIIRRSAPNEHGYPAPDRRELDRASQWLRAFHRALHTQLQVTHNALAKAANTPAAQAQGPPPPR
jgi:DivIVA domain-containing protein